MINKNQWEFLKKSAELGKLPHALLFSGPEHSGKRVLAIEFAKFLIDRQGRLPKGQIEKGTYPDFVLVEPAGREIQISQIRKLIEKLSFKPYLADFKVAVLDNAHLMTKEAQNCFLKFLEEPAAKTFLILVSAHPLLLLPTILSRVQKIRFFPAKDSSFKLTVLEQEFILDLIKLSQSNLSLRFQYAKDISKENLEEILDNWLKYLRRIFLARLRQKEGAKLPAGSLAPSGELSSYSLAKLKDILNQIQLTKTLIFTTNTNPRLALELLLMKL